MSIFKSFWNKLTSIKRETYIKNSFLAPILFVVLISISHVVTWYDLGNPWAWAMYLSVAVEVFALASISAASIHISRGSIWFLFGIVTAIQMIGNIFFSFNDIDVTGTLFNSWIELIKPLFDDWTVLEHRRFLAVVQGGSLPIMSLTALNFYLKFNQKNVEDIPVQVVEDTPAPAPKSIDPTDPNNKFWKGLVPKPDVPKPDVPNDDEDMAKFNPQE